MRSELLSLVLTRLIAASATEAESVKLVTEQVKSRTMRMTPESDEEEDDEDDDY
jgi:hypothetical protein